MKNLLIRFIEYDENLNEGKYICSLEVESYDCFINFIKSMKNEKIILVNKIYEIINFSAGFNGNPEEDAFYLNVYCSKYF